MGQGESLLWRPRRAFVLPFAHGRARLAGVFDRQSLTTDHLSHLVSPSGDDDDVALARVQHRPPYGTAPVKVDADSGRPLDPTTNLVRDEGRGFVSGIVARQDDMVGARSGRSHGRSLRPVPVATRSED